MLVTLPLLLAAGVGTAGAATVVNTCGQTFSGSGFLSADLDCSGFTGDAVVIDGGSLDLRGFDLIGGQTALDDSGIRCSRNCKVFSSPAGGRVRDANGVAIIAIPTGNAAFVKVKDIVLSGNGLGGILSFSPNGNINVVNSTISDSPSLNADGVDGGRVKIVNSTIDNVGQAITASRLRLADSSVSNCTTDCMFVGPSTVLRSTIDTSGGHGVTLAGRLRLVDSTISGHAGHGIASGQNNRVVVIRSTISSNAGRGIHSGPGKQLPIKDSQIHSNGEEGIYHPDRMRLTGTTVTGNGLSGISTDEDAVSNCGPVRLIASTVTGNGTDGAVCGVSETCSDVSTCAAPVVLSQGSTCDTSYDTDSGFPGTSWGICTLD